MELSSSRRELLIGLLGSAAFASCKRQTPTFGFDGGFVESNQSMGHRLREGFLPNFEGVKAEQVAVVILGGGISGLSAGWRLLRSGVTDFRIVEAASAPGGTSVSGTSSATSYPWGAHYLPAPTDADGALVDFLHESGAVVSRTPLVFSETQLCSSPKERIFYQGEWHRGLYPATSSAERSAYGKFRREVEAAISARHADGRRVFTLPVDSGFDAPQFRALDEITFSAWLEQKGISGPLIEWYVDYACRDDFGLRAAQTSAWYGLHYFAARTEAAGEDSAEFLTWPSGNGHLVDRFVQSLGTGRIDTDTWVLRVAPAPDGRRAQVFCFDDKTKKPRRFLAEHVVFSLPSFLRSRVIKGFTVPSYETSYAPWLVANLHFSGRPGYAGFEVAWDNVIFDSDSLGYVVATHQGGALPLGPTVWTYYLPLTGANARDARGRLDALSYRDAADAVVADLDRCHFDLRKYLRRVDIKKWGHGMVQPRIGTRFSAQRSAAARPAGPIHFAHTDLSGVALFEEAFAHGIRAADEVRRALGKAS